MNKKLALFGLMGSAAVILSGCTIPGTVSQEQFSNQTTMLIQMQQDMETLLSGVNALQKQNEDLAKKLADMQVQVPTHGAADMPMADTNTSDILGSGSSIDTGTTTMPMPSSSETPMPIGNDPLTTSGTTSTGTETKEDSTKSSLLEELKKANSTKTNSGTVSTGVELK